MATRDEVARQPLEQRRARLALTADELAAGIHGQPEAVLARRRDLGARFDADLAVDLAVFVADVRFLGGIRSSVVGGGDR